MDEDTIVIQGAGLSGLSSALTLSSRGKRCRVIDTQAKNEHGYDVRALKNYSSDNDILVQLKEIGLGIENTYPIYKIKYFAPNGKNFTVFSKEKPLFYNVIRGNHPDSLDIQYTKKAEDQGVVFDYGSQKQLNSTIIAQGSRKKDGIAYGKHFRNVKVDCNYLFQDENFAPGGYIYILPYGDNEASIVITSFNIKINLKDNFDRMMSEKKEIAHLLEGALVVSEIAGSGGYNIPAKAFLGGRYYVGESAGFVDAARGFGMYYALLSGYLAAKSIAENLDYDKLWKSAFGKELFNRFARRQIISRLTNNDHNHNIETMIGRYGSEIPIETYKTSHKTQFFKKIFLGIFAEIKLQIWRRNHPLG